MRFYTSFALAALAFSAPAAAAVSPQDVQVALRSLMYLSEKPQGAIPVAVIYSKALLASELEAKGIAEALAIANLPGMGKAEPRLVAAEDLSALGDVRLAFLTEGLSAHHEKIFNAVKGKKVLSVTTDKSCVQAGRCVMSVQSQPKVEIVVSRAASAAAGLEFVPNFRMLISEI